MLVPYLWSAVWIVALQGRHEGGSAQFVTSGGVDGGTLGTQDGGGTAGEQYSDQQESSRGGATVAPPAALHGGFGFGWLVGLQVGLGVTRTSGEIPKSVWLSGLVGCSFEVVLWCLARQFITKSYSCLLGLSDFICWKMHEIMNQFRYNQIAEHVCHILLHVPGPIFN